MYVLQLSESCCDADLESRDAIVSFLRCLRADKKDNQFFRHHAKTRTRASMGATEPTGGN